MTNDFITIFNSFTDAQKDSFRQYIYHFYATNKVGLQVFEHAVAALAMNKDVFDELPNADARVKMSNDLYDVKNWAIEFLTVQHIRNNSLDAQFLTLEALRNQKGLTHIVEKKTKQLNAALSKQTEPNIWSSILTLRLADADYFTTDIDPLKDYQPQMQFLLDELDNFYICNKLKYLAELSSRAGILKENYKPRLLNDIQTLVETDASLPPLIKKLYLPLLLLTKDKSPVAYAELKALLMQNALPNRREKLITLMYLLNFTAIKQKQEPAIYYQESFDLAQIGLQESLFTSEGYFPTATFINIVNTASYLKKYPWARAFINKWSPSLNKKDHLIVRNLALARVHFEEGDFEPSLNLLTDKEIKNYKNSHFSIHFRLLIARANYEAGRPTDVQKNHCVNSETYIRRSPHFQGDFEKSLLSFFKILTILIDISDNKKTKEQLFETLDKADKTPAFDYWLREKINKLK